MKFQQGKQDKIQEKLRKPRQGSVKYSPFAEDLVNFIFSGPTMRVLEKVNPTAAAENKMVKKFYEMWYKYFPEGVITPADWTKERWDWFEAEHERTGRSILNLMEARLFRGSARNKYTDVKTQFGHLYHSGDRADALTRLLRYAQDREKYAGFLRTRQGKRKPPPPPPSNEMRDQATATMKLSLIHISEPTRPY